MFRYVRDVSLHVVVDMPRTSMLSVFALLARTRRVASDTTPPTPSGSNRRNARTSGEPSVRICERVPKLRSGSPLLTKVSARGWNGNVVLAPAAGIGESVLSRRLMAPASARASPHNLRTYRRLH